MNKNQIVLNNIRKMEGLSKAALNMIACTDLNSVYNLFGGCSCEELNSMAKELIFTYGNIGGYYNEDGSFNVCFENMTDQENDRYAVEV